MKFTGIDGGLHKQWNMWFNLMQLKEPYRGLTCCESFLKKKECRWECEHMWCMVIVSSCRKVLG